MQTTLDSKSLLCFSNTKKGEGLCEKLHTASLICGGDSKDDFGDSHVQLIGRLLHDINWIRRSEIHIVILKT